MIVHLSVLMEDRGGHVDVFLCVSLRLVFERGKSTQL